MNHNIKTIFIIFKQKSQELLGDLTAYDATFINFDNDFKLLQEEFTDKITMPFLKNVNYIHLYIFVHGSYDQTGTFTVSSENGLPGIKWASLRDLILKYLGHIPMFVIGGSCLGIAMQDLIFKLPLLSRVITTSSWFTPLHVTPLVMKLYKHPLVFIQTLVLTNPSNEIYDSLCVFSYKSEKELIRFEYLCHPKYDVVTDYTSIKKHSMMIQTTFLQEMNLIYDNFHDNLKEINKMFNIQDQYKLYVKSQKQVGSFVNKYFMLLFWSIKEITILTENLLFIEAWGLHKKQDEIDSRIETLFVTLNHDFSNYETLSSLLNKFKKRFKDKVGASNYDWTLECFFKYSHAYIETYEEVINSHICPQMPSYTSIVNYNINCVYHLSMFLKEILTKTPDKVITKEKQNTSNAKKKENIKTSDEKEENSTKKNSTTITNA